MIKFCSYRGSKSNILMRGRFYPPPWQSGNETPVGDRVKKFEFILFSFGPYAKIWVFLLFLSNYHKGIAIAISSKHKIGRHSLKKCRKTLKFFLVAYYV